jgi:NAD(P)-dependent dehydrogenase (short-subunit alcohol dehydrogenase family)
VVATARRAEDLEALAGACQAMTLDVTDDAQRKRVVQSVLAEHGRIDALVNNAGHGATLSVEDTSPDAMRAMFDVNVFALHALSREVLPAMRRQGHGRIVNVASVAGHVPVPLMGAYCASKFAVRALTQTLDMEVRRFGVRAVLVEPGPIRTRFGDRSTAEQERHLPGWRESPYAPLYRQWAGMRQPGKRGAHPGRVARKVVHACLAAVPRNHYFVPTSAWWSAFAKRVLPDAWVMAGMRAYFRGKRS